MEYVSVLVLMSALILGSGAPSLAGDPPLLGYAIEPEEPKGVFRLVDLERDGAVLVVSNREVCERRRLERLEQKYGRGHLNVRFVTLGGKQFWEDLFVYAGWRIQRNVYSGHCRLLDDEDVRRAWGGYPQCRVAFEHFRLEKKLALRSDHLVLLVHGLGRSKDSFQKLKKALIRDGYEVASVNYPSTRRTVREHAQQLAGILARSRGIRRVSFVTHSLGGIVVRDLLSGGLGLPPRVQVGRVVMIAPPSRGSIIAETLHDNPLFEWVAGESGQQLTPESIAGLPPPPCDFAVIAGGKGDGRGYSPLLPGDDDGIVTVENTKLPGMKAFATVKAAHTFIMNDPDTIERTRSFLRHGRF